MYPLVRFFDAHDSPAAMGMEDTLIEIVETKTKKPDLAVIALKKGESIDALFLVPMRAENFIEIELKSSRRSVITAKDDILLVVEDWDEWNRRAKHVRFARKDRRAEGGKGLDFVKTKLFPALRRALDKRRIPPLVVRGGFEKAVLFEDEIAVPDFFNQGSRGWIVLRKDIGEHLSVLPPIPDSGKIVTAWVEKVGYLGTPQELAFRFTDHDPTNDPPLTFFDSALGAPSSSERRIYEIRYDEGSRTIKQILDLESKLPTRRIVFQVLPYERDMVVGRRMPKIVLQTIEEEKKKREEHPPAE